MHYPRIKALRQEKHLTQKSVANAIGMQLTVYQRYENGERELSLSQAIAIADFYGVSLDYLCHREFFAASCKG